MANKKNRVVQGPEKERMYFLVVHLNYFSKINRQKIYTLRLDLIIVYNLSMTQCRLTRMFHWLIDWSQIVRSYQLMAVKQLKDDSPTPRMHIMATSFDNLSLDEPQSMSSQSHPQAQQPFCWRANSYVH